MKKGKSRRRAFVLVMTLVLLSIAAVLAASIARQSLSLAAAAEEEVESLRLRWGVASCRHALLGVADRALVRRYQLEDGSVATLPVAVVTAEFRLSGDVYRVVLADEQAKADVNTLAANLSDELVRAALADEVHRFSSLMVKLAPMPVDATPERRSYQSWGQVIGSHRNVGADLFARELELATRRWTCWASEGRLHLRAASDEAVAVVAGLVLSPIEVAELLEARRDWDGTSSAELIEGLSMTERKRELLTRLLCDDSRSRSLWVHVEGSAGSRHYFFVDSAIEGGVWKHYAFAW